MYVSSLSTIYRLPNKKSLKIVFKISIANITYFLLQSMVPLNGGGSLSSSRETSEATPMEVSENDEENEIESV